MVLTLGIAVALAACQPLPHPFADDRPAPALLAVPDIPDIAVGAVVGEPQAVAGKLPAAVARELVKHNVAASDVTGSRISYRLDGRIEQRADQPGKSLVTVYWQLRDPRGKLVRERSDHLVAATREWNAGKEEPVAQLAAASAAGLAASMLPETPKEAPGGGRTRVAVRKVAGAPGDGDTALATSLSTVLKHRDIELVDPVQGKPDIAVDCDVTLDPAKEGKQHVKIVWRVARAAGGEIGKVAQENDVPRGRLDAAWGDVAYSVAVAAEEGIMQLVDRGAPVQKRGAAATAAILEPSPADAPAAPASPPVAGNIDSPAVNLPPVNVGPSETTKAAGAPPDIAVPLPYRGVPIQH